MRFQATYRKSIANELRKLAPQEASMIIQKYEPILNRLDQNDNPVDFANRLLKAHQNQVSVTDWIKHLAWLENAHQNLVKSPKIRFSRGNNRIIKTVGKARRGSLLQH
jgi:mRNA-degrading endonuclease RelE of RelBE toxin-antitoxin system